MKKIKIINAEPIPVRIVGLISVTINRKNLMLSPEEKAVLFKAADELSAKWEVCNTQPSIY